MTFHINRVPAQTPYGIFTNMYPWDRLDRQSIGVWYLSIHVGTVRISFYGTAR